MRRLSDIEEQAKRTGYQLLGVDEAPCVEVPYFPPQGSPERATTLQKAEELAHAALVPKPKPAHPDAVERGVELPLGFVLHKLENRTTRLAATATWTPPKAPQAEGFWSEPLPPEHFEAFYLGQVGNSGDGERVRVVEIDRAAGRVRFEPVTEEMPTRRELVAQKQKHRRGVIDLDLRRAQRQAAARKAKK